ncbi:MAG: hypothetical protein ACLVAW_02780 [Eisenbergiella massiliensis]
MCLGFFFCHASFANTALDYLSVPILTTPAREGWGLIGVLSQVGYVAAYALAGVWQMPPPG